MREAIGRVVHSPWFVVFLIALPVALGLALFESFSDRMVVTFLHVEVAPTEPDGDAWDGKTGLPDPHVVGKQRGKQVFECPKAEDVLVFDCAPNALIDPRYKLEIVVGDVDVTTDDVIAKLTFDLPAGGGTDARYNVDGLKHLSITIKPRPSAIDRFGSRLIAVGVGIAFVLFLWFLYFKRPLTEPESHALGWIGGGLALVALVLGGMLAGDSAYALPPEAPCALGAAAATLGALHASAVKPLRWYAAVLMFLGTAAVLLPIVLTAALIVGGLAILYVMLASVLDSL